MSKFYTGRDFIIRVDAIESVVRKSDEFVMHSFEIVCISGQRYSMNRQNCEADIYDEFQRLLKLMGVVQDDA